MSKKVKLKKPFEFLSLQDQVHSVMPIAQKMLDSGLRGDPEAEIIHGHRSGPNMVDLVIALVGDPRVDQLIADNPSLDDVRVEEALHVAHALGIAIGLMLRSDAFLEGGAR